ncbi:cholesterol esterase [Dispira parvispora]|uniref:Cholesterol esterase n=1 Tax=Dispira parvispora TaxID=1520584 RepID=A0A9W8AU29_9FUNG|nr:cholesterol esterase [Dispira parvispora]
MFRIPILGRLSFMEYQSLFLTALFFLIEKVVRIMLFFVPIRLINRVLIRLTSDPNRPRPQYQIPTYENFNELAGRWGYSTEEHTVVTRDGYVLGIHRLPESPRQLDSPPTRKPVVLLWHGFMMCSDVFVCMPNQQNSLALYLADAGYDVWLGNSRGNKYSYRHLSRRVWQTEFWDFSIDELAMFDIPDTVDYILAATGAPSLAYIGFSQGTAQMFCALASNKPLNDKISIFLALAPATTPRGFDSDVVNAMVNTSPQVLYLLLGRKEALSIAITWKEILPSDLNVWAYDTCLRFLFGWETRNLGPETKKMCYQYLYSFSSVKTIVHWMQIIRTGKLQFYDEMPVVPNSVFHTGHVCHRYPTSQIDTPIALFHGGKDTLSSTDQLVAKELKKPAYVKEIAHYEHLDFLWADDVKDQVLDDLLVVLKAQDSNYRQCYPAGLPRDIGATVFHPKGELMYSRRPWPNHAKSSVKQTTS